MDQDLQMNTPLGKALNYALFCALMAGNDAAVRFYNKLNTCGEISMIDFRWCYTYIEEVHKEIEDFKLSLEKR